MPPDPLPQTPDDVAAFLAKSKVPRARAVKKLEDVLRRAASGDPDVAAIRELWVFGSFARGAAAVGDVDLLMTADDPRNAQQFGLDTYYGERPFAKQMKALGCSGGSIVSVQPQAILGEAREPASPERLATMTRAEQADVLPVEEAGDRAHRHR